MVGRASEEPGARPSADAPDIGRVLILHNKYQHKGGEDTVVESEATLLERAGVDVEVLEWSNDAIGSLPEKARAFLHAGGNPQAADWLRKVIAENRPAILHIHNFWPLLSPSVHLAAAESGVAVVQTLHNYRLLCANGMFLRGGQVCEQCTEIGSQQGVIHRCYRGSLAGSIAATWMQRNSIGSATWLDAVDQFIALTGFAKGKFVAGGLPQDRISIKPNSVPDPANSGIAPGARSGFLFVGRLSNEKGCGLLIEAMRHFPEEKLTIVGSGPEESRLRGLAGPNVHFVGALSREQVMEEMARAAFLVLPSLWYEGFPMTLVESFASGLPVIASDIGALGDLVGDGANGLLFRHGSVDALSQALKRASSLSEEDRASLGLSARQTYLDSFTQEANLAALLGIYGKAMRRRDRRMALAPGPIGMPR